MPRHGSSIWVALLVAAASLGAASTAQASSIFFLRAGNVWVANPNGSGAKQVTTDGSYDFVSSAKQGTAPPLAFHRGGSSSSQYGTVNPDGTGETVNPYNSTMQVGSQFFTRLDNAGDRVTYPDKCSCSSENYYAGSVGTNGASPQLIYNLSSMDARDVTFGDPTGSSLLFTDTGGNYTLGDHNNPCNGTDNFTDILVLQTPPPSGSNNGPTPSAVYCDPSTLFFDPALRPDGQLVAAESESNSTTASTQIVTFAVSGGVATTGAQTAVTQITPPNSGDTLPDFSPDGSEIVFQGPSNTIYTVPAGGGTPAQVLTNASVPAWSPYTLPAPPGPTPPGPKSGDELSALALTRTVHAGKPLIVDVTLKAPTKITIEILRYVPGTHRRKSHYVPVGTVSFTGKTGLNKVKVSKVHGHKLSKGSYEAEISAGGRAHGVTFKVK